MSFLICRLPRLSAVQLVNAPHLKAGTAGNVLITFFNRVDKDFLKLQGPQSLLPIPTYIYMYTMYINIVHIYIYTYGTPQKNNTHNTFRQIGEVGGTNKSEFAMCIWRVIKMLNEHPPTSDQIYI